MNTSVMFISVVHFVLFALFGVGVGFGESEVSPFNEVLGPAMLLFTVRSTTGSMFRPVANIRCSAISCGVTMCSEFSIDLNWLESLVPGNGACPLSSHRRSSLFQDPDWPGLLL